MAGGILRTTAALAAIQPTPLPGGQGLVSPLQFATTGDDNLRIGTLAMAGGVTVRVRGRFLRPDGSVEYFSHDHETTGDSLLHTSDAKLGEGFLLNLSAICIDPITQLGSVFCVVHVIRGLTGATELMGVLLQGYVTTAVALAWPGSPIVHPLEGRGLAETVPFTSPALGADLDVGVDLGMLYQIHTFSGVLTTSAAAGNRRPYFSLNAGFGIYFLSPHSNTVGPSSSVRFCWCAGAMYSDNTIINNVPAPLPIGLRVPQGHHIQTVTPLLDAGDQWSELRIGADRWLLAN